MRRVYESTFIINAALEDTDIDAVITKVTGYIENHGGEIQELEKWGRKRLAYPISKKFNGYYVHVIFDTLPDTIPVLERFLSLEDTVIRHLTMVLPQKLRDWRSNRAMEQGKIDESGSDNKDNKEEKKSSKVEA